MHTKVTCLDTLCYPWFR